VADRSGARLARGVTAGSTVGPRLEEEPTTIGSPDRYLSRIAASTFAILLNLSRIQPLGKLNCNGTRAVEFTAGSAGKGIPPRQRPISFSLIDRYGPLVRPSLYA
jgi:hypothetical protein